MPPQTSPFGDAADRPAASYLPDIASEVDTAEDFLREIVDRVFVQGNLSFPVARTVFVANITALCISIVRQAHSEGYLAEVLGEEPTAESTESLARLLAEIIDADNPRLHAKCIDFALGLGVCGGRSQRRIGREEGVSRAAVSKRCKIIQKAFGLPPSRGMKSEKACESYSRRQKGKRARPMPEPWQFNGILGRAYGQN